MRLPICLGFIILLSACATTTNNYYPQTIQSWRGGDAKALVSRWGMPDKRFAGPNGTTVYVYQSENYRANTGRFSPSVGVNFNRTGTPTMTTQPNTNFSMDRGISLNCTSMFVIDNKSGKVVSTQSQGNNCVGNSSFAEAKSNPQ